jgi:hypothetical protein
MPEHRDGAPSDPHEDALLAFLSDGRSYGLPDAEVKRITTHAAHVFLVGQHAYKMKRPVRYSFLDFTTLDRRKRALAAELELNRRTAPMLYRRLVPVTRADGDRLALAGSGDPVEWLLEMASPSAASLRPRSWTIWRRRSPPSTSTRPCAPNTAATPGCGR